MKWSRPVGGIRGQISTHGSTHLHPPTSIPPRPLTPQIAQEGLLDAEGFYWIPNLAGPTTLAARGTAWLYPFVDGAPPVGWDEAGRYLVLPTLLVVAQYISSKIITPPVRWAQRALLGFIWLHAGGGALAV
jgi:YidC/Oxa1 family membrane protein insertase